ncbi:hypothetical protein TIFTF001_050391 [Ficus carica]|uniref:Uncharacterized protein n=1 Tax=Ficus carica TaxID=3494 RepID=A0AA88CPF3_FICCA|nr:hypothetical protein TIFTF001_050391 [Ficus carica]
MGAVNMDWVSLARMTPRPVGQRCLPGLHGHLLEKNGKKKQVSDKLPFRSSHQRHRRTLNSIIGSLLAGVGASAGDVTTNIVVPFVDPRSPPCDAALCDTANVSHLPP